MELLAANQGHTGPLGDGAILVDQFVAKDGSPKNVAFKACGVSRFVITLEKV
jgi:hypothetical protein